MGTASLRSRGPTCSGTASAAAWLRQCSPSATERSGSGPRCVTSSLPPASNAAGSTRSPTSSTRSKSAQPGAKAALAEIWNAEDREHAEAAARSFVAEYGTKWPRAVAKVTDDLDVLLEFYDYPEEHWVHLRTTNPVESTFATVRLRQRVTKGPDRGRPAWRWRSSSSSPPSNGGVPSTRPTSSLSSGPEPGSRRASWSNVPTNQEAISKSHDTPIRRS